MREKKFFAFNGTVVSAKGWLKKKAVGKPVRGIITILGQAEDFAQPINRLFKVGVEITQVPLVRLFPWTDTRGDDYPYLIRNMTVHDSMRSKTGTSGFSLVIVPWDKLADIKVRATTKKWHHRFLLDEVKIEGDANMVNSEKLPNVVRKV